MNDAIFYFFYNLAHKSEFFDKVVIFFAEDFIFVVAVLAIIFLLIHQTQSFFKDGWLVFFSGGIAWGFAQVIKNLLQTPRPFALFSDVIPLVQESGYAFPSGHTAPLTAIAFAILFLNKKVGYAFILFALLVGMSRIIAGVHFPIDIIGGFVLGAIVAYLVRFLLNKLYPRILSPK
jgi:undecaprenyl-diphosphatase